jgi:hypothetical protein
MKVYNCTINVRISMRYKNDVEKISDFSGPVRLSEKFDHSCFASWTYNAWGSIVYHPK